MTISIIKITADPDFFTGEPFNRTAHFTIVSGGPVYSYSRGGLPLTGGVQAKLDAEEASLYAEAAANGVLATGEEIAQAEGRAWFLANSAAVTAIFGGTVATMDSSLGTLLTAMFPAATANQRTQMRYALMAGLLTCRCYANGEGLV